MKKLFKYITIVLVTGGLFQACETTDLDLRVSPNDLASDQADPNLLLNSIQLAYASNQSSISDIGAQVTRIDYMFGRNYFNNYSGATFNGIWERFYSSGTNIPGRPVDVGILTNIQNLESIDAQTDVDYSFHIGVGKVLAAHVLFQLADYLGQAVWSEALQPAEFPAPTLDDGPAIYAAAQGLLNEGEALLASGPATQGATDMFYGGDTDKWIKLINTLRLRAAVLTGDTATFNSIIAGGDFIAENDDDFQFAYGTSELQPDDRHPDYAADYTPSGANIYQSNWLMETMLDKGDPRIRYYFYRQVDATPGADAPANEEDLACSLAVPPQHFQDGGYTYCSVPNGYWGRTHGNDEGTPPDNFKRVAVGVYPAGGRFDDSSFGNVGLGLGGGGAGIEPIILASYVDFWRGIMATSPAQKAAFMEAGLEKHIAKVQSFGSLDGNADASVAPTETEVETYISDTVAAYLAASGDDQQNIFAEQYFITLFGGATEAYNYYRLTGFPTTLVPNWEPDPGAFPRSFLYAQNEVITNPNIQQKTTLTEQVFWDTNPASPTFPPAN
ncbi:SusD/RagB family nutrient-binding outer membrane lipoprotein [Zeaxanthinibacter enoshimensis]|uniref:SusD-like starch-binding protein associating with outer membrane n=1 Tax=Zeaxanthinibacter enoshimensis TaxID=392009 RepID=A0A4R6TG41_9FLAO|nr:SusD/RagB family nutrient-binding outer membrane lipoprotein [Zeaxanthinibacter enoshimensis]TDQ28988.1 SusD-like starch-binding protein associating with outer membrane [Zeaxanthinibacter enoshimensis]